MQVPDNANFLIGYGDITLLLELYQDAAYSPNPLSKSLAKSTF